MSQPSQLTIHLERDSYLPGEPLTSQVHWSGCHPGASLTLRLLWATSGYGDCDVQLVQTETRPLMAASGEFFFSFQLPTGPESFKGHLIQLHWLLEAVVTKPKLAARQEFHLNSAQKLKSWFPLP